MCNDKRFINQQCKRISWLMVIVLISCTGSRQRIEELIYSDTTSLEIDSIQSDTSSVMIVISSMTSPKETYIYYNDLLEYFSAKSGKDVTLMQRKTYSSTNNLIKESAVDLAFICTGAYINNWKDKSSRLLVVPVINGQYSYKAYIITHKKSGIKTFYDLKGKSFAFTDPLSNTGYFYPQKRLLDLNAKQDEFFSKTIFTYAHDLSIELVNNNVFAGASVDGLILNYLMDKSPEKVKNIKIIEKSESFGMPPVVVPINTDSLTYVAFQKIFLNMHKNEIGRAILDKLNIDSFIFVSDTIYNSANTLRSLIDETD